MNGEIKDARLPDLTTLIVRMARKLRHYQKDCPMADAAMDYLHRSGSLRDVQMKVLRDRGQKDFEQMNEHECEPLIKQVRQEIINSESNRGHK